MKLFVGLLFLLILSSGLPLSLSSVNIHQEDEAGIVPAPEFESINPDNDLTYTYEINTTVTIRYKADRFKVGGLILLGFGSNLTENVSDDRARNFTKVQSLKGNSWFEVEINVTSYTYFFAISWSQSILNNTKEEIDFEDNAKGHQLWVENSPSFPSFISISNTEDRGEEFYAPLGSNVTITYDTPDPMTLNSSKIQLSFANTTEQLYNSSESARFNMTQLTFAENNRSRFAFNYTINQRIVFFAAFNDFGWERSDAVTPITHRITTGFTFNSSFSEDLGAYTELDNIIFNVTSFNQTAEDSFFYRYRYFENETSETPLVNWTSVSIDPSLLESVSINNTQNFTTTKNTYYTDLGRFNVSQKIEIQAYVEYLEGSFNETAPKEIIIQDSRPMVSIFNRNETITNSPEVLVKFDFGAERGEIESAFISSNFTGLANIENEENATISFQSNGNIIEGNHTVLLNVTASLQVVNATSNINQSRMELFSHRVVTIIFIIDTTAPVASFDLASYSSDENGKVSVSFNYADVGQNDTGVDFVKLSWGNNIAIDATDLSSARFQYTFSGNYTIELTVIDKAGNSLTIETFALVTVPKIDDSFQEPSPINTNLIFAGLLAMMLIYRKGITRQTID